MTNHIRLESNFGRRTKIDSGLVFQYKDVNGKFTKEIYNGSYWEAALEVNEKHGLDLSYEVLKNYELNASIVTSFSAEERKMALQAASKLINESMVRSGKVFNYVCYDPREFKIIEHYKGGIKKTGLSYAYTVQDDFSLLKDF
jgi:hypothetical protein